ncbi:hypothetical protein ACQP2E_19930 [Actinoplanes sp. CA-015351]|uniref:hypothetical protein n=1 Tax=Actinoplanes sp. CA-015351 TaxID=3239897 RepID=UPI003D989515
MWRLLMDRPLVRIAALAAIPILLLTAGTVYLLRLSSDTAGARFGEPAPPGSSASASLESSHVAASDADADAGPGTDPRTDPGSDPGTDPGTDPGSDPGTDTGSGPGTDPDTGADPATGPGRTPVIPTETERLSSTSSPTTAPQPPLPKHATISVGGVRLDNSIPSSNTCVTFANTAFDQPIRAAGAVVTDGPGYIVVDDSECRSADLLQHPFRSCEDVVLEPGGPGCDTGIAVGPDGPPEVSGPDAVQRDATIRLRLEATCTSREGTPCSSLDDSHSPSAAAPIEVSWTDGGRERTVFVLEQPSPATQSSR